MYMLICGAETRSAVMSTVCARGSREELPQLRRLVGQTCLGARTCPTAFSGLQPAPPHERATGGLFSSKERRGGIVSKTNLKRDKKWAVFRQRSEVWPAPYGLTCQSGFTENLDLPVCMGKQLREAKNSCLGVVVELSHWPQSHRSCRFSTATPVLLI